MSGPETIRWLNHLNADVDDVVGERKQDWVQLLAGVIGSPIGLGSLSSHNWQLLAGLMAALDFKIRANSCNMATMRSLEGAEEWEKLGVWMVVVWSCLPRIKIPEFESMEGIEQITLKLLSHLPSALPMFEDLCKTGTLSRSAPRNPRYREYRSKLRQICDQVRAEHRL